MKIDDLWNTYPKLMDQLRDLEISAMRAGDDEHLALARKALGGDLAACVFVAETIRWSALPPEERIKWN